MSRDCLFQCRRLEALCFFSIAVVLLSSFDCLLPRCEHFLSSVVPCGSEIAEATRTEREKRASSCKKTEKKAVQERKKREREQIFRSLEFVTLVFLFFFQPPLLPPKNKKKKKKNHRHHHHRTSRLFFISRRHTYTQTQTRLSLLSLAREKRNVFLKQKKRRN